MGGCEPAAALEVSAISKRLMPFNTILCRKGIPQAYSSSTSGFCFSVVATD